MTIEIKVPTLPESVTDATVAKWYKKPGDKIERDENLVDLETDKVMLEVPAPHAGTIENIVADEGSIVKPEEVLAVIQEALIGEKSAATPAATEPAAVQHEAPAPKPATEPMAAAVPNEPAVKEAPQAVRPAAPEAPRPAQPQPQVAAAPQPSVAPAPQPSAAPAPQPAPAAQPAQAAATPEQKPQRVAVAKPVRTERGPARRHVGPAARRAAGGTGGPQPASAGPAMQQPQPAPQQQPAQAPVAPAPQAGAAQAAGDRTEKRVPMSRLRARIAERLLESQHNSAILTTFNEVDMAPIMQLRARYKDQFEKQYGVRLGFMSFFTSAAVEALKRFPEVNASIDGNDIVYHNFYDIGIAIGSDRGLVVPIIRNAEHLNMAEIEIAIRNYAEQAKTGKIAIEDMTGGTFTISNGGVYGSLMSTPIINPPQSAILGMHKIMERPMVVDGKIVVRPMMYLALSYDHRIIDGTQSVQFLLSIKEMLEDPARLMLQV